jgi:enoyl-CoA hydratase
MPDPYRYPAADHRATFSMDDAPSNLMSLEYSDRREEQLPEALADDGIRAMVLTAEWLDDFSAGMALKQVPGGVERAGGPEAVFHQRNRVLSMIGNGGRRTRALT